MSCRTNTKPTVRWLPQDLHHQMTWGPDRSDSRYEPADVCFPLRFRTKTSPWTFLTLHLLHQGSNCSLRSGPPLVPSGSTRHSPIYLHVSSACSRSKTTRQPTSQRRKLRSCSSSSVAKEAIPAERVALALLLVCSARRRQVDNDVRASSVDCTSTASRRSSARTSSPGSTRSVQRDSKTTLWQRPTKTLRPTLSPQIVGEIYHSHRAYRRPAYC
jgi:hypothetical protein